MRIKTIFYICFFFWWNHSFFFFEENRNISISMNSIGMLFLVVLLFFLISFSSLLSHYFTFSIKGIEVIEMQSILSGFHEIKIFDKNKADIFNMHNFLDDIELRSYSKRSLSESHLYFDRNSNDNAAIIQTQNLIIDLVQVECD
jgi:hypothetical protein